MPARTLTRQEASSFDPPQAAPERAQLIGEAATAVQPLRLALQSPRLLTAPRGNGRVGMAIPGWRSDDLAMAPIRHYLNRLGHDVRGWTHGTNMGQVEALRDLLVPQVAELAESSGRSVNLIGWSLGGVIAREIAREIPDAVHHVVTYGSPIIGGPTFTVGAAAFGQAECERITALQTEMDRVNPIRTPITAMFTKRDNIVDWRACIDSFSPNVTMVEVGSTHIGLGIDPDVWLTAAKALAER